MYIPPPYDGFIYGKNPLLSKTVIFNIATTIALVFSLPEFGELFPAEWRGHLGVIAAVINIYLRTAGGAPLDWKSLFASIGQLRKKP